MLTPEQKAARRRGIGGSDIAILCGMSPWRTARALYHEKRGELEGDIEEGNEPDHIRFGHLLEDVIAQEYARRHGVIVVRGESILAHPTVSFALANVDYLVEGVDRGLEIKNVSAFNAKAFGSVDGSDEVPDYYALQCQWYMGITQRTEWDLAALVGGNRFRWYRLRFNPALFANLLDIATDFWKGVQAGVPPDFDYEHGSTADLINRLYPGTDGTTIALPEAAASWSQVEREAGEKIGMYEDVRKGAKAHIAALIGSAAIGLLPDGTCYTRKVVTRKPYAVEGMEYVDMRFAKKVPGKGGKTDSNDE